MPDVLKPTTEAELSDVIAAATAPLEVIGRK